MANFKKIIASVLCAAMILSVCGCSNQSDAETTTPDASANEGGSSSGNEGNSTDLIDPVITDDGMVYEAEDAFFYGTLSTVENADFSGGKGVEKFENGRDYIEFNISLEEAGVYDIVFVGLGIGSDKENNVFIDGEQVGVVTHLSETLSEGTLLSVMLEAGAHSVTLKKSWGWIQLDKMIIRKSAGVDDEIYNVTAELINPNATAETKSLYKFLCDNYGEKVISGQVCDDGYNGAEFKAIYDVTGKYPAMLGLDMMDYSENRIELGAAKSTAVDKAIQFSNEYGGIVTFCWHWNAPNKYVSTGSDPDTGNPAWWGGFYTRNTTIDLAKIMSGEDAEGKELLDKDIATIAEQLNILEEAGVPVLWRPLHEASGGWFWWGAKGAEPFKQLWIYLYDQLTNVYECNNLIWVYNGQAADWYPGDEYVDIVGEDIYPGQHVYSPQTSVFVEASEYSDTNKIVALTENGCIFDIDAAVGANTMWAWFNTWGGEFAVNGSSYSEKYTEKEIIQKAYDSEYVLSLDELPDNLKTY